MRKSKVLITDALRKKNDGVARVFYHSENIPFATPVIYSVWHHATELVITDCKIYALAYADAMNHLHILGTNNTLPMKHCAEPSSQEHMDTL